MKNLLITSMRDESLYCLEWIAYHKNIGFDHFLIYTNDNNDKTLDILKKIEKLGFITVIENNCQPSESPQIKAFTDSIKYIHKYKPSYIMCLDADEFLDVDVSLDSFIQNSADFDAVAFNWKMYGSGGSKYKGIGFSLERFIYRAEDGYHLNKNFKTLFKYREDIIGLGPHRPHYRNEAYPKLKYVYSDGEVLDQSLMRPGSFKDGKIKYSGGCVNHYVVRSYQEFLLKRSRGNALLPFSKSTAIASDDEYFNLRDKNVVIDKSIHKHMLGMKVIYMDIIKKAGLAELLLDEEINFHEKWVN